MIPSRLFVAGIDTDAGKTLVSALFVKGMGMDYWKPIQAGTEPHTDTEWVARATGLPKDHFHPEAFRLEWPASPHASAAREGIHIPATPPEFPISNRPLLIEGAGGLHVPLSEETLLIDWLEAWQIPVLLVAKTYLGCINHSLLSIESLRKRNIPLWGIVFNDGGRPESEGVIASFAKAPVLGNIPKLQDLGPNGLQQAFEQYIRL